MNKTETLALLSNAEIETVNGGWCGTPWPGQFGGIIPPQPEPDPWYRLALVSKLDMVALNPQPLPPKSLAAFEIQM